MKRSAMNISSHDASSAIITLSAYARPARANSITPTPNDSAKRECSHHALRRMPAQARRAAARLGRSSRRDVLTRLVYCDALAISSLKRSSASSSLRHRRAEREPQVPAEPRRATTAALARIDVEELAGHRDHLALERGAEEATCRR